MRYSVCELKMLGTKYTILKCRHWLSGLSGWSLITDHKGLMGTFAKQITEVGNARQRRYREKHQEYVFKPVWRKGLDKTIHIADCLSRNPLFKNVLDEDDNEDDEDLRSCGQAPTFRCGFITENKDPQLQFLCQAALQDKEYEQPQEGISSKSTFDELPEKHIGKQYKGLVVLDNLIVPHTA